MGIVGLLYGLYGLLACLRSPPDRPSKELKPNFYDKESLIYAMCP